MVGRKHGALREGIPGIPNKYLNLYDFQYVMLMLPAVEYQYGHPNLADDSRIPESLLKHFKGPEIFLFSFMELASIGFSTTLLCQAISLNLVIL